MRETRAKGTSTFVMASIDEQSGGIVNTLNLGDSGFFILRPTNDESEKNRIDLIFKSKS